MTLADEYVCTFSSKACFAILNIIIYLLYFYKVYMLNKPLKQIRPLSLILAIIRYVDNTLLHRSMSLWPIWWLLSANATSAKPCYCYLCRQSFQNRKNTQEPNEWFCSEIFMPCSMVQWHLMTHGTSRGPLANAWFATVCFISYFQSGFAGHISYSQCVCLIRFPIFLHMTWCLIYNQPTRTFT